MQNLGCPQSTKIRKVCIRVIYCATIQIDLLDKKVAIKELSTLASDKIRFKSSWTVGFETEVYPCKLQPDQIGFFKFKLHKNKRKNSNQTSDLYVSSF